MSATRSFARSAFRLTPSTAALRASTRNTAATFSRQAFRQQARGYSSEAPAKSSSAVYWGVGALALGGAGYYFYGQGNGSAIQSKTFVPTKEDYQKVYDEIASRLEEDENYDDGSYAPVLLRLAWHSSGTYDKETGTGGSNGATMRFGPEAGHGANAGLSAARDFLEPVKAKFPWISYSDLWILGGVCAVQEMHGPTIPFRPGREDKLVAASPPDGRLPDASQWQDHVRKIFYRMGFNDQEIVAIVGGGHTIGRCHKDRSGFDGPWTFSPTYFTNEFFKLILNEKWNWRKWDGPKQFEDAKTKTLMMLPGDMALVKDKQFKQWVEKYAKDEELFFKDFSNGLVKLFELGVPFPEGSERFTLKATE